jgi:tetratricopeptide (TPR) repeat protein
MRRVVFIGNCQVQSLSQLYQRFSDGKGEEQVAYLPSYEDLTADRAETVARADIVVEQRMDVAPRAEIGGIVSNAERHFVPLLAGGFLWPFAGQPHPRNEGAWFMPGGPYGAEMSDSYLNRLIDKGTPPAEAVEQYLALDVGRVRHLDRLFELIVDRQRSRDAACGYQLADLIEERFRDEPMFRTPHHPNLRLALSFTAQFFQRMGMGATAVKHLHERVRVTPFPKLQLPIHPAVAQHFGLKYADTKTRYRFHEEGRLTFAEYALRYMTYDWNRDLAEGVALLGRDAARAIPKIEAGLERSPNSADGWYGYAEALRRSGRPAEAETAVRRALAIDPAEGRCHFGLAHILADFGRLDEAAQAVERALALDPFDPHFNSLSANLALRLGRLAEAEACVHRAIELEPANPHLHSMLGDILLRRERLPEAIAAIQRAIELKPDVAGFRLALSRALVRAARIPEAIEAARRAAALDPNSGPIQGHLSSLLAQRGDVRDAETNLRALLAADPANASVHEQYGHLLVRLGRPEDAEAAFRQAMVLAPNAAGPLAGLSHTLARIGRHHEAIAAIEAAIEIEPRFLPFHIHRGNQLWVVEQFEEAAAAYQAALNLDPTDRHTTQRLRDVRAAMEAVA